jgi:hypothetical protein
MNGHLGSKRRPPVETPPESPPPLTVPLPVAPVPCVSPPVRLPTDSGRNRTALSQECSLIYGKLLIDIRKTPH